MNWVDDVIEHVNAENFVEMIEELIESGQILTDTDEEGNVTLYAS